MTEVRPGADGDVVVRVRDTGIGIRPELAGRIFDMFTQGDRITGRLKEGLGLGLTLVKTLVEMHGGSVAVASAGPGKGSEFTVRLPLPAAGDVEPRAAPDAAGPVRRLRVLVVDDNRDAADSLRANSDLRASEYSTPVLGLIFLRFSDNKYRQHEQEILAEYAKLKGTRREKPVSDIAIEKCGFYLPDHARYEYPVTPDAGARESVRVFSVDEVVSTNPQKQETVRFQPFYSYRHGLPGEHNQTFWYASRRDLGNRVANGPEVYVVLVDLSGRPMVPGVDVLNIRTTCTNGEIPQLMNAGAEFQFEGAAPVKRALLLLRPTPPMEPPAAHDSA